MARVELAYKEHANSMDRWGNYTSAEITYVVFEAEDEDVALNAVRNVAPVGFHDLPLDSISIDSRDNDTTFHVVVVYQNSTGESVEEPSEEATVSFECGSATKHMQYALSQRHPYGNKNANGAIGWNGKVGKEMEIAGVDVPTADVKETRTKVMRVSSLTTQYLRRVISLYGCVNNRKFYGWEKGEAMFLGITYAHPRNARNVVVSFHFSIRVNERNVKISGHNIGDVEGFEYISAIPATSVAESTVQSDVSDIYVNQVVKYGDFGLLGV